MDILNASIQALLFTRWPIWCYIAVYALGIAWAYRWRNKYYWIFVIIGGVLVFSPYVLGLAPLR